MGTSTIQPHLLLSTLIRTKTYFGAGLDVCLLCRGARVVHLGIKSQIVRLLKRVAVKEPDALGDIDLYLHLKDDRCDYYISGAVPLLYNDQPGDGKGSKRLR